MAGTITMRCDAAGAATLDDDGILIADTTDEPEDPLVRDVTADYGIIAWEVRPPDSGERFCPCKILIAWPHQVLCHFSLLVIHAGTHSATTISALPAQAPNTPAAESTSCAWRPGSDSCAASNMAAIPTSIAIKTMRGRTVR